MPDTSESSSGKTQSWWTTLPGVLTALAAVITALGALIGARQYRVSRPVIQAGIVDHTAAGSQSDTSRTTTTVTTTSTTTSDSSGANETGHGGGTTTHETAAPVRPEPTTLHVPELSLSRHDPGPGEDPMATFRDVGPHVKINYYDNQSPRAALEVYVDGAKSQFSLLPGGTKSLTLGATAVSVTLVRQSPTEAVVNVDVQQQKR
jgi:hypothetical protein